MWSRYMYRAIVLLANAVEFVGRALQGGGGSAQADAMLDRARHKLDLAQRSAQDAAELVDVSVESRRQSVEMVKLLADMHKNVLDGIGVALDPDFDFDSLE